MHPLAHGRYSVSPDSNTRSIASWTAAHTGSVNASRTGMSITSRQYPAKVSSPPRMMCDGPSYTPVADAHGMGGAPQKRASHRQPGWRRLAGAEGSLPRRAGENKCGSCQQSGTEMWTTEVTPSTEWMPHGAASLRCGGVTVARAGYSRIARTP